MMPKIKLLLSAAFFLLGALRGYELSRTSSGNPILTVLIQGYILWGLFWGVPVVWTWWRNISGNIKIRSFLGLAIKMSLYLVVPLCGGYFYGVFGGGIYQAVRHARLVRSGG